MDAGSLEVVVVLVMVIVSILIMYFIQQATGGVDEDE